MRIPLRFLALLLLAACSENPVDSLPNETSFTAQYRQGSGGWQSFAAQGQQPAGTSFSTPGPWVFTGSSGAPHVVLVVSAHQQAGGGWTSITPYVPNRTGTDSVGLGTAEAMTCPGSDGLPCTFLSLTTRSESGALTESCVVENGKMYITRRTSQWVSGRFSGTGTCRAGNVERAFQVQDGAFDLALPPPAGAPG